MERLPPELCSRIFSRLDHRGLATALQVCRKWKRLASEDALWRRLFTGRWGADSAQSYGPPPDGSKSWKGVYEAQHRGLKRDYYLVLQGKIQRCLGGEGGAEGGKAAQGSPCVSDKMLFFLADCPHARRGRR